MNETTTSESAYTESVAGFGNESALFGRGGQLATLGIALASARNGVTEVVVVSGPSGLGTSSLLKTFVGGVSDAVVGFGSYSTDVDSAVGARNGLMEALGQVARSVLGLSDAAVETWTRALYADAHMNLDDLVTALPVLAEVLGSDTVSAGRAVDGALDMAPARLHQSIRNLVESTANAAGPLVLVLDNVEDASPADAELIRSLVSIPPTSLLLIVGIGSADVAAAGWSELSGAIVRRVELAPLDERELEEWMRLTYRIRSSDEALALIEARTGGNPLLVEQLVRSALSADVLVDVAGGDLRQWPLDWLRAQPLSEGIGSLLAERLRLLTPERLTVLSAAACLDETFDATEVSVAAATDPASTLASLWSAVDAGLVVGEIGATTFDRHQRYRFAHRTIAAAAREFLTADDRRQLHLRVGNHRLDAGDTLGAVAHLAEAGDLVDPDRRTAMVDVGFAAGDEARHAAAFTAAHRAFANALTLAAGTDVDAGTLFELHYGLAETARLIGSSDVDEQLTRAWQHARSPVERARVSLMRMKVWLATHRGGEALEEGLNALAGLGMPLQRDTSKARVGLAIARTAKSLHGRTDDEIMALPRATDETALIASQVMTELFATTYAVAPEMFPFVVLKSVDLTLQYGRVPVTPIAFGGYGQLLVALNRHESAFRYGQLMMRLAENPESQMARPGAAFAFYNFIFHWKRPASDAIVPMRAAFDEAMRIGDHEYGAYLAAAELAILSNTSTPLEVIETRAAEVADLVRNQHKQWEICEALRQVAHNFMGWNPDPMVLGGTTGYDERVIVPRAERENDVVSLSVHAACRLGLECNFGDFEAAARTSKRLDPYMAGLQGTTGYSVALVMGSIARLRSDPKSSSTKKFVKRTDRELERYAKLSPETYGGTSALIKAERAMADGKHQRAEALFLEGIRHGDRHGNSSLRCSARDGITELYISTGREEAARGYILEAARVRAAIGHRAYLERAIERFEWLRNEIDLEEVGRRSVDDDGAPGQRDELVDSLLAAVMTNADPDRCLLVLRRHESLRICAAGTRSGTEMIDPPALVVDDGEYAASMLRMATRLRSPVSDVRSGGPDRDRYLNREGVGAVAVVPIIDRGRTVAALHLERASTVPFDASVLERVGALARPSILSIENAYLEHELEAAERQQASLQALNERLVPAKYLEALGSTDARVLESGNTVEREWASLFADLRSYTLLAERLPVDELNDLVTEFVRTVEPPVVANDGFVHDTRGDEVLALFADDVEGAVRAAIGIVRGKHLLNRDRVARGDLEVDWGVGLNFGPVYLGFVDGVNHRKASVLGDSLNLASRIEGLTKRYGSELLVSEHVLDRLPARSQFKTRRAERVRVMNRRVPTTVFEVYDADADDLIAAKDGTVELFVEAFDAYDTAQWEVAVRLFEAISSRLPGDRITELHLAASRRHASNGTPPGWDGVTDLLTK